MSVDESSFIKIEKKEGYVLLTLNRPAQGNALRLSMYGRIEEELQRAAKDDTVEAVVIIGSGKFFSTGADVAEAAERVMKGEGLDQLGPNLRKYPAALTKAMIEFPKILIAAVNGPVIGYPAAQLGLYDLVFVSDTATYQVPLLHLGLVTEGCSSYTLYRTVGRALANDLLITGRTLSAQEMVSCGIASRVLPTEKFSERVISIVVEGCSSCAVSSMLNSKKLMLREELKGMLDANEQETVRLIAQFESGEPMERFANKFAEMKKQQGQKKAKL